LSKRKPEEKALINFFKIYLTPAEAEVKREEARAFPDASPILP
jgi:hypothetical protein